MNIVLIILAVSVSFSCNNIEQEKSEKKVVIEFRLAATKPAENLAEYSFRDSNEKFYLRAEILSDNNDISDASVTKWNDVYAVEVKFTKVGKEKWAEITGNNIGKHIAILVNNKLVTCPLVRAKIDQGVAIINGNFSKNEAEKIAQGLSTK